MSCFVRVRTSGDVGSVKIWVKGAASKDNTENYEPYDSKTFDLIAGDYNITTKIFSQPSGHGEQCDDRTFNFSIKECNTAPACNGESSDIWLVGSNGREIQVSNGQQLCLVNNYVFQILDSTMLVLELELVAMLEV